MKTITLLTALQLISTIILAQFEFNKNAALDVYGFGATIEEKLLIEACDCCSDTKDFSKDCVLYKIKINDVFLHRDTSVYLDTFELGQIQYLIIPSAISDHPIKNGEQFVFFARNSCFKELLIVGQILETKPSPVPKYTHLAYTSGLLRCKKLNLFQRLSLVLGSKKEKVYEKAKAIDPEKSFFVKAILSATRS